MPTNSEEALLHFRNFAMAINSLLIGHYLHSRSYPWEIEFRFACVMAVSYVVYGQMGSSTKCTQIFTITGNVASCSLKYQEYFEEGGSKCKV